MAYRCIGVNTLLVDPEVVHLAAAAVCIYAKFKGFRAGSGILGRFE
jgi:hypothetical protein